MRPKLSCAGYRGLPEHRFGVIVDRVQGDMKFGCDAFRGRPVSSRCVASPSRLVSPYAAMMSGANVAGLVGSSTTATASCVVEE